ncbi:nucleoside recognition family protein [Bacterioplanes sanyensis]|uniref:Nucleoside recognition family protein n=1 Tax=Bacterioplanes sanyensis TaxID=1249553 RepID=A0A222FMK2_9GAMM|nr:nucleoside recognition family protein [Bacterioplanes sanyensis]ASP40000.1 nucleoside recognition family protein [Bacterioplanes sanyensis]
MDTIAALVLEGGRAAVELALFILLPIMIVMLSIMRWLEAKGILQRLVALLTPVLTPLGLTGLGVFAFMQVGLVSFAAPMATLALMARNGSSDRHIAATLAMVLAMSQANILFPMATLGLDITTTLVVAAAAGLLAAVLVFYVFGRSLSAHPAAEEFGDDGASDNNASLLDIIRQAGRDAWDISIGALPLLVVALVAVKLFTHTGAVGWMTHGLAPVLLWLGYPIDSLTLIVTKFVAGGTAMMGLAIEQMQQGLLETAALNRLAGLLICPLDVAGVAILASAGKRVMAVAKPAVIAALLAVLARAAVHIVLF